MVYIPMRLRVRIRARLRLRLRPLNDIVLHMTRREPRTVSAGYIHVKGITV